MSSTTQQLASATPQAVDFSKYVNSSGEQSSTAPTVDFTKYDNGSASSSDNYWNTLKDKYGLPHSVDLSKTLVGNFGNISSDDMNRIDPEKYSQAFVEANPDHTPTTFWARTANELGNLWRGATGESSISGGVAGSVPLNPVRAVTDLVTAAKQRG